MLKTFTLDSGVVAPCIYRGQPHKTTQQGVMLSWDYREELQRLLTEFLSFAQAPASGVYLRLDCFLQADGTLAVIEINSSFVDGWGTAFNLVRASGHRLPFPDELKFPQVWSLREQVYLPELELAVSELPLHGGPQARFLEPDEALATGEEVYWYGRFDNFGSFPLVRPADGIRLDNKMLLARFSNHWRGRLVTIPHFYGVAETPWEQIPADVVFKLGNKTQDPRNSVKFRDEIGHGKFFRRAYNAGEAIAQARIEPITVEGAVTQVIIMAVGSTPITGYLQIAYPPRRIINDNSFHGPLVFAG